MDIYAGDTSGFLAGFADESFGIGINAYNSSGWKYKTTGFAASHYYQFAGTHVWRTAPSGTAGNAITFTQAMTLDASGRLGIGTTSPVAKVQTIISGTAVTNGADTPSGVFVEGPESSAGNLQVVVNDAQAAGNGGSIAFGAKHSGNNFAYMGLIKSGKDNSTSGNFAGYLSLSTRPSGGSLTERMRIDSAGNLFVGTTSSPETNVRAYFSGVNAGSGDGVTRVGIEQAANTVGARNYLVSGVTGGQNPYFAIETRQNGSPFTVLERMRIDSSGNLGLGVTPSAWASTAKVIQIGAKGAVEYRGDGTSLVNNAYFNSGWKYISTGGAALYNQYIDSHAWFTAPSGTAGNAITFTQAMTLDASGNLGIGTSSPTVKLDVAGDGSFTTSGANSADTAFAQTMKGVTIRGQRSSGSGGFSSLNFSGSGYVGAIANVVGITTAIGTSYANSSGVMVLSTKGTSDAAPVERMRLDAFGNLGLGTTTPAARIVSAGSSATNFKALILRNGDGTTGSSASIDFEASSGTQGDEASMAGRIAGVRTGSGTSGALTFSTTNAGVLGEKMRLDSGGNLGLGTTSPSASAILDAQSVTRGVRMPNMTTAQKNAIASPAAGLMVFDTTLAKLCVYTGAAWQTITSV
jgi:hypothetical protein